METCNCPRGMKFHAGNCPTHPGQLRDATPEMTREQHARIESLANEHGRIMVHPVDEHGIVKVEFAGRGLMLDEDGLETIPPMKSIPVHLPTDLVKRLLGADLVDEAILDAGTFYPNHVVGRRLGPDIVTQITALVGAVVR